MHTGPFPNHACKPKDRLGATLGRVRPFTTSPVAMSLFYNFVNP
ncbi:MAG: hypothetical protein RIR59_305, partial [Pseudomonadota bacterium]